MTQKKGKGCKKPMKRSHKSGSTNQQEEGETGEKVTDHDLKKRGRCRFVCALTTVGNGRTKRARLLPRKGKAVFFKGGYNNFSLPKRKKKKKREAHSPFNA